MRAAMPSSRSSSPSSTKATPSQVAPASSAARATGTAPWPYASALTTANNCAGDAKSNNARTLARMPSRWISAHACRTRGGLNELTAAEESRALGEVADDVAPRDDADELAVTV